MSWDDVAGLEMAKEALKEAVILPIKFPQLFQVNFSLSSCPAPPCTLPFSVLPPSPSPSPSLALSLLAIVSGRDCRLLLVARLLTDSPESL